jgi:phytoene dehydrogenase-like protein
MNKDKTVAIIGGGMTTFGLLLDREDVPEKMRRKVQTAPLSHKAVSIQLGLTNKIDVPSHLNAVLPWMPEQHKIFAAVISGVKWPSYSVPTVTMPELAPAAGSIIELYVPAAVSEQDTEWDAQKTEGITAAVIETLSHFHHLDIAVQRVRAPKDFQQEMHLYQGVVYGLSPAADPRAQFPQKNGFPVCFWRARQHIRALALGLPRCPAFLRQNTLIDVLEERPC